MIFWILVGFCTAPLVGVVTGAVSHAIDGEDRAMNAAIGFVVGFFIAVLPATVVLSVWESHASDISKVIAQEHRIEVFQDRVDSLTARLESFGYPEKPAISLDADTPWASMVEALTEAETQLANAKDERAIAIRSIEARKRGPLSGVTKIVPY